MATFQSIQTVADVSTLNIKKIENGKPTGNTLTNATLTAVTDGGAGTSWCSFSDTSGQTNTYSLFYFFSGSNIVASASTYIISGSVNNLTVDNNIYKFSGGTGAAERVLFAVKMNFPERYAGTGNNGATVTGTVSIHIATVDPDIFLDKELHISHEYCGGGNTSL